MEVLDLLKTVHDEAVYHTEHIRFDKKHPWHLHLVGLYGSLIELSSTVVLLIENKRAIAVPVVFRSFLEAYVDFTNLSAEPSYGNYMKAAYIEQRLKVLREAKAGNNLYLADIAEAPNLDAEIQELASDFDGLKKKGYRPLKVFERFAKAGMVKEYRSLYRFISGDTHNDIRALISRHTEVNKADFRVVYYKEQRLESYLTYFDSICSMLILASKRVHEVLGTSHKEAFDQLAEKLNGIRSRYDEIKGRK